jgi:hypothetical protein
VKWLEIKYNISYFSKSLYKTHQSVSKYSIIRAKGVPLHALKALVGTGGIDPTNFRPRL